MDVQDTEGLFFVTGRAEDLLIGDSIVSAVGAGDDVVDFEDGGMEVEKAAGETMPANVHEGKVGYTIQVTDTTDKGISDDRD